MKSIDKTSSAKKKKWSYGTVLKCWDNDPDEYRLFRIASDHHDSGCELDMLYDSGNDEKMQWYGTSKNISELMNSVCSVYRHAEPVKATITIEDL